MGNYRDINVGSATSPAGHSRTARRGLPRFWLTAACLILGLTGSSAGAALFIDVGSPTLLPGAPGQEVAIRISNDGPPVDLGGFELLIQVADGGPGAGGSIVGPRIDGVDLLTGTPFEGHALGGQFPALDNSPQRQFWNVVSLSATLGTGSDLLLATVSFDSTGLSPGTWDLSLSGFEGANTRLLDRQGTALDVSIANGTLTVVPEPAASAAIAGCLLVGGVFLHRARRRSRA